MNRRNDRVEHVDDADLSMLYRKSKANTQLSETNKRWVLSKAAREHSFESRMSAWSKILGQWTLAASLILLVGIVSWQSHYDRQVETVAMVNDVVLESAPRDGEAPRISDKISARKREGELNYLAAQTTVVSHHQTYAKVLSKQGKLELVTCGQKHLTIDKPTIDALSHLNQLDESISAGDFVSVSFDDTGLILSISKPLMGPMC